MQEYDLMEKNDISIDFYFYFIIIEKESTTIKRENLRWLMAKYQGCRTDQMIKNDQKFFDHF